MLSKAYALTRSMVSTSSNLMMMLQGARQDASQTTLFLPCVVYNNELFIVMNLSRMSYIAL